MQLPYINLPFPIYLSSASKRLIEVKYVSSTWPGKYLLPFCYTINGYTQQTLEFERNELPSDYTVTAILGIELHDSHKLCFILTVCI